MSNARNLANLLGTNTTIQTAKLADDAITNAKLPAGSVLQVVSGAPASGVSYDTTTGTEYNVMTLDITPNFNTSKILIFMNFGMYMNSSANEVRGDLLLRRGTTLIAGKASGGTGYFRDSNGHFKSYMTAFNYLDSPATTSATTYKAAWIGNSHNVGGQFNEAYTNMTLIEISA